MKELSVFVDEAGVFGPYDHRDPYYILSLVFHNQDDDLSTEMSYFEENIPNTVIMELPRLVTTLSMNVSHLNI